MKKILFLLLIVVVAISLPVLLLQFTGTTLVTSVSEEPASTLPPVQTGPSLKEKVGQLFVIGHWSETMTSETASLVDELHLGGIIIMDSEGDGRRISSWTRAWQNVSFPNPLLVGVDQEGGVVSRLKDEIYVTIAQPDITDSDTAYDVAAERAGALTSLGINTNFSPVVDRSVNPDSFMYDRVFREPALIANLSDAMVRGYQNNDVIAVPKHFPGHPDTADDSHLTLPILDLPDFEAYEAHTQPFTDLLQAGNAGVLMTAHVKVPILDPDLPTTLSPIILNDLRERIGFDGVIVTDDLAMQAVSDFWNYEEAAILALNAGVDMLMLAAEPEFASSTIAAVVEAVEAGELSEERIDEAYERVQIIKERLQ